MTEAEAQRRWCPFVRLADEGTYNRRDDGTAPSTCMCIASRCMAWRWMRGLGPRGGYCGLAGETGAP